MSLKQLYPDLWQSPADKRFGSLTAHAYVLALPNDRVVLYTSTRADVMAAIAAGGSVSYQYLSHCHEVDGALSASRDALGAQLYCHVANKPYFEAHGIPGADVYTESVRETHGSLEVIHTPGHTTSNLCYLYDSPHGKRYLFVGDTLYLDGGTWNTVIVGSDGGNANQLRDSLALLRDVDPDVIITSISVGETTVPEVTREEWHVIIDDRIAAL